MLLSLWNGLNVVRVAVLTGLGHRLVMGVASWWKLELMVLGVGLLVSLVFSGPRHRLVHSLLGTNMVTETCKVEGYVAPGFEKVKKVFEENVNKGLELGAQFVVYHKGEKVVDLWGGSDKEYDQDSLQIQCSCSKVVTAFVVAMFVDKGLLDYDEKVAHYWPEFAQNGKENITIADVLRHDSGLAYFEKEKLPLDFAARDRLDELAEWVAKQKPIWEFSQGQVKPKDRIYQGNTRGFILNELIRRVDPKHRSVGQLIREDLVPALGDDITMVLGDPTEEERKRIRPVIFEQTFFTVLSMMRNMLNGYHFSDNNDRSSRFSDKSSHIYKWFFCQHVSFLDKTSPIFLNMDQYHVLEQPSVNVLSNAKSMAKLADIMSRKHLLKPETYEAALSEGVEKFDGGLYMATKFGKGGFCHFQGSQWGNFLHSFHGWGGFGGSAVCFDPTTQTGLSYSITGLNLTSIFGYRDPRCLALIEQTMNCIHHNFKSNLKN